MTTPAQKTFIIDCPWCKAKVAATETGRAEYSSYDEEPYAHKVLLGTCPSCKEILVGEIEQTGFKDYDSYEDHWSDVVRIYPKPPKTFSSARIPRVVKNSLNEADRCLQAGANTAACAMLGRAFEALCRDILTPQTGPKTSGTPPKKESEKKILLAKGIEKLHEQKIIDDRLFNWGQQLRSFRNIAAHPEDISISREDTEDLQTFMNAIIEYIYDLTDRYEEFKDRIGPRASLQKI